MSAEGNGFEPLLSPVDTVADVVPDVQSGDGPALSFDEGVVSLAVTDLIQDANGEVVLDAQGIRSLALDSNAAVVGEGMSDQHVTANGDDVSGFKYIEFDNGLTLYFDPSLDVVVKTGDIV